MNKRLEKEFDERVVEKRGRYWAMASFVFELGMENEKYGFVKFIA
jgi:hypothetical protein